jgi:hypothetical protein
LRISQSLKSQVIGTGDPGASTHWLKQIRVAVHMDDSSSGRRSVSSRSMHSLEVQTSVISYHSCDQKVLPGLRHAQAAVAVLCSAAVLSGLVHRDCGEPEQAPVQPGPGAQVVHGGDSVHDDWGMAHLHRDVHQHPCSALVGPSSSMNIGWVDDAFFGCICTPMVGVFFHL